MIFEAFHIVECEFLNDWLMVRCVVEFGKGCEDGEAEEDG